MRELIEATAAAIRTPRPSRNALSLLLTQNYSRPWGLASEAARVRALNLKFLHRGKRIPSDRAQLYRIGRFDGVAEGDCYRLVLLVCFGERWVVRRYSGERSL